jgi:hypothetical protein
MGCQLYGVKLPPYLYPNPSSISTSASASASAIITIIIIILSSSYYHHHTIIIHLLSRPPHQPKQPQGPVVDLFAARHQP